MGDLKIVPAYAGFTIDPQPVRLGTNWHIYARYPGGFRGHILSFESEAAALAWIEKAMGAQEKPSDVEVSDAAA
jgi:hypothetical protein